MPRQVGAVFARNGKRWIVTSISTPTGYTSRAADGDLRHATVTLRADDAESV